MRQNLSSLLIISKIDSKLDYAPVFLDVRCIHPHRPKHVKHIVSVIKQIIHRVTPSRSKLSCPYPTKQLNQASVTFAEIFLRGYRAHQFSLTLENTLSFRSWHRRYTYITHAQYVISTRQAGRGSAVALRGPKQRVWRGGIRGMALIRRAIKLGLHWIGRTMCPGLNGYTQLRLLRPLWPNVMPPYGLLQ